MAEERELDLDKAADLYAGVIERFDASRERAANAIFRSGECLWKLGEIEDAKNHYGRITREFADFPELVRLSEARLKVEDSFMKDEKELYTISLSSHEPEICFEDVPATLEELEQKLIQGGCFDDEGKRSAACTEPINRFQILGQVVNPGFYEVPSDIAIDVLDAIAIAGGYTRLANKVTLKYPIGEEEIVATFKLRDLKRVPTNQTPKIKTNSTIIVGESSL